MKKTALVLFAAALLMISGCSAGRRNVYLPEAKNDKIYTTVDGKDLYKGVGYTISVPSKNYRYEKDYDDGNTEEKWEYTKKDDVQIKVTTYKGMDEITARGRFLRENDDYIFEDLNGQTICGIEFDGDELCFRMHEADGNVYIISWEYPKNTKEKLKKELSDIAETFKLAQ